MCYKFIIPLHIADTNLYEVGWILDFLLYQIFIPARLSSLPMGWSKKEQMR